MTEGSRGAIPLCPVCRSTSLSKAWQYKEFTILQCRECDLQFVENMGAGSLEYYQEKYQDDYVPASYQDIHPGFQFTINKIREVSRRYLSPHQRRVIDVGCGPGILLVDLKKQGFDCLGIDFNADMVRAANERFQVPAQVGRVEDLTATGRRFDLALLSHVLEHVDDPVRLLRNVRDILDPGGILIVELPNRKWYSPSHSLEKGSLWWFYYPPHHVTFWSIGALEKGLAVAGYSVIECIARPFDDMERVETFLSNRLKLPRSWLFSAAARALRTVGRLARLQGGTLHAVARRVN